MDWNRIQLAVFDVDGTLYNQKRLRLHMLYDIARHVLVRRDLRFLALLKTYRHIRERLGEEEADGFEQILNAETAAKTGYPFENVQQVISEWMEERPLPYLDRCRYPGLAEVFAGLRKKEIAIGIFSDYPATKKLAALGLSADFIVCAGDQDIGFLKPHPRGLEYLIDQAMVAPETTVLIGDRIDRDGLAARRAGVYPLIRSSRPIAGWQTFPNYRDMLFQPLLNTSGIATAVRSGPDGHSKSG